MAATSENGQTPRLIPAGNSDDERLQFIEEITEKCDEVQGIVLAEILKQNGLTEYLRRHGVDGATDRYAFKEKIPVVSYEDLQPDIERIANGDKSAILSGHPISEFYTSSGTSAGERKLMPTTHEETDRRDLVYSLQSTVIRRFIPGIAQGKGLYFCFVKSETITPGGFLARPVLTSYFKSAGFRRSGDLTSPIAAILCPDSGQSMYIQMLSGLYLRLQVLRIGSVFASSLLRAVRFLQTRWPEIAADIAAGELSSTITDPSLRSSLAGILRPDPVLSRFISDECSNPDWTGIITRIWPNTRYVEVIITGTMSKYIPTLQLYSGGLPLVSSIYGSSECYFGLNLTPICSPSEIVYTLLPNLCYFEFLPLDGGSPVDLAGVELDKEYEIVVTTYAGLYRYRVGDVLQVAGFYNSAPQFKFLRRKNVILSIESDKTDEAELLRAVEAAAELLTAGGCSVVEYTSHADAKESPGHYVIYWELLRRRPAAAAEEETVVMEKCCLALEEEMNSVYRQSRVENGSIGPLEIRVVRTGTFEELMDYSLSRGASINQYKVPRCVNFEPILELLDSRVEAAYFSRGLPRWKPNRFE